MMANATLAYESRLTALRALLARMEPTRAAHAAKQKAAPANSSYAGDLEDVEPMLSRALRSAGAPSCDSCDRLLGEGLSNRCAACASGA